MCLPKQFSTAVSQQNFKTKTNKEGFQELQHLFLGSSCVPPPPFGSSPTLIYSPLNILMMVGFLIALW